MKELSLHILDVAENSLRAGSTFIKISIIEDSIYKKYKIIIEDNGYGMSQSYLKSVTDPFVTERTTRKIGLGLPLFKQTAELCGGEFKITSKLNQGTKICVLMDRDHIDLPPVGSISDTVISLVLAEEECDIEFYHKYDNFEYVFSTHEIKKILKDDNLNRSIYINWMRNYLNENEKNLIEKGALS